MLLNDDQKSKLFLCASANWRCVIQAFNSDQAAAKAVQEAIENDNTEFSIGSAISVTELSAKTKNSVLVFSPRVLADIGMHSLSSKLLNIIDQDTNDES